MVPFTGLGNFSGYRGDQWLKNRIKIFNEFVLPSLQAQGSEYFHVWFCWRPEEKTNPIVKAFMGSLEGIAHLEAIHTFGGIPFYDDKYDDKTAKERLLKTLEVSLPELKDIVTEPYVLLTIQPSDDMYLCDTAKRLRSKFSELLEAEPEVKRRAVGFVKGYIMCYNNKEIAEYTTNTAPPFFTILFPSEVFLDPQKHFDHIGPYTSHEFISEHMNFIPLEGRGFVVGTHGENISTVYNHRYRGRILTSEEQESILIKTGTLYSEPLNLTSSTRLRIRRLINRLPFRQKLKELYYALPVKMRKI